MELHTKVDEETERRFSLTIMAVAQATGKRLGRSEAVAVALDCWMDCVEREHGKFVSRPTVGSRKAS